MDKRKTKSGKKEGDKSDLLTQDEMKKLLNVVAGDLYYTTLYNTLRYTGRRIGEIYGTYRKKQLVGGIKLKDIDFNNKQIKTNILKTKKRKTKRECSCGNVCKSMKDLFCPKCGEKLEKLDIEKLKIDVPIIKFVPMRDELINILKLYINNHQPKFKPDDYIFRDYSLKLIQKRIKEHIKKANINKNFSLHGFRHYFISNLIKIGTTENQIIKWTGHTNTASLTSYNQLVPDDIKDKVNEADL